MKERKSSEAGSKKEADNQQRICGADASIALGGALGFSNPGAQMFTHKRGSRKTSVFLSRETGISGNFVGRIKGAKCPFDLQFLTWDFS